MNSNNLLKDIFPELSKEMKDIFLKHKREDLYSQVDKIEIFSMCECGQDDCGSFYTMEPPTEDDDFDVEGFVISAGLSLVEVYDGRVGFVEILASQYGREVHEKLRKLF